MYRFLSPTCIRRSASRARILPAIIALAALLVSSCSGGNARPDFSDVPPDQRAAAIFELQTALIDDKSADAAGQLIRNAERARIVQDGIIREAIDLSVGSIRYYSVNPLAALEQMGTIDAEGPLEIVDYGPVGVLPIENSTPRIYVMFNQPMIPLAKLGDPITESDILTIDPPVSGIYRWYGTKTFSFEPDEPLISQPRYTVTVSGGTPSLAGESLGEDLTFAIFGERVKIVNLYPGTHDDGFYQLYNVPPALAQTITVEFNQPVDLDVLAEHLELSDRSGTLAFTLERPEYSDELSSRTPRAALIRLENEPPENTSIEIVLAEGAVPREGYPETLQEQSYRLRTIYPFAVSQLSAYAGNFPMDNRPFSYPVYLEFTHDLAEDALEYGYVVRVDGQEVVPDDAELFYSRIRFFVPGARPGQTVSIEVPAGVGDIYGRTLSESATVSYDIPRPYPQIEFPSHYSGLRHLEAEFVPKVVYSMRNLTAFTLGAIGVPDFFRTAAPVPGEKPVDLSGQEPDYVYFFEEDLAPLLNADGYGTVRFTWTAEKDPSLVTNSRYRTEEGAIGVQVTDLGITTRIAYNRVLVWVNRLSDGSPVPRADVEVFNLRGASFSAVTDSQGLAAVSLDDGVFARNFNTDYRSYDDDLHIRVKKDGDTAELLTSGSHNAYRFDVYSTRDPEDVLDQVHRVFMFTDRGIYKAGEELAIRGIHWLQNANGFAPAGASYDMYIRYQQTGEEIWRQRVDPSDSGGFSYRLTLPENLEPGDYRIYYQYGSQAYNSRTVSFYVGNFRRVAFQVNSRILQEELYVGDTIDAGIQADYLAGGAVPSAPYSYFWTRKPVTYVPPGPRWEDWSFGTSEWGYERNFGRGEGTLSGAGSASIAGSTLDQELEGKPYRYTLETRVEDIDRQVVASTVSALVHPAEFYIGARFSQGSSDGWWSRFVPTGAELIAEISLADVDGNEVDADAPLTYGLIKGEWKAAQQQGIYGRINTRWEYVEETLYEETAETDAGRFEYGFAVEEPGRYTIYFIAEDSRGRTTRTEIPFYATGSGWVQTASQTPSDIDMVVDKGIYEPGETARILVQSPLPAGRYLLSIEREGIISERIIELDGSTEVVEVPVRAEYVPVFYVAISSFTERTETEDDYFEPDLGKPRGLFGITSVHVATTPVELDVQVESSEPSYGPGDEAELVVRVTRDGRPVSDAEVTLLAVDRGVLDLIDYHVPDPIRYFYADSNFPLGVRGDDSRRLLLRPVTYDISTLQGGDSGKAEERKDFNPLALFEPEVRTDADGYARVSFTLPDSLTTYRLTAMALDGNRLGLNENELMVQNPVNVRTALPRRFRNRDTAATGVVLTNTTGEDQEVTVSVESDILRIAGERSKTVTIPPGTVFELPFVLEAVTEGEGEIRFATAGASINEVLIEPVIVERPLVTEAFATVGGVFDPEEGNVSSAVEGLVIPSAIADGYGSLSLAIDSTLRPFVQPSIDNLLLPFSPLWASFNSRLYDLAARIAGGGRPPAQAGILNDLADYQFENGGIGYRSPRETYARPSLYLSALAAQTVQMAGEFGVIVDNGLNMNRLYNYLEDQLNSARSEDQAGMLLAWTAKLLAGAGRVDGGDLEFLENAEDRLGIAGYNLLAEAFFLSGDRAGARRLYQRSKNFMNIGTQSVDLLETYEARGYFDSMEAELALFMRSAALLEEPADLLIRLAGTVNQNRNNRRFHSRHDDFWLINGFAPLILAESARPDMQVEARIGETGLIRERLGETDQSPAISAEYQLFEGELADLPRDELLELEVSKDGRGQIYYTSILRYALPGETSQARDEGIELRQQIETLDGTVVDGDVLPLGETLRVRIFISATRRMSYLNLLVPVPSGAEILDPSPENHRQLRGQRRSHERKLDPGNGIRGYPGVQRRRLCPGTDRGAGGTGSTGRFRKSMTTEFPTCGRTSMPETGR
jgi:uncharacterized protein YfaS (alpha-2-macroglobulin family)